MNSKSESKIPKVLNYYKLTDSKKPHIYIGRPRGSSDKHYGNPFTHLPNTKALVVVGTRQEAVQAFQDWLDGIAYQEVEPERRKWILEHLEELRSKDLVCWCAPAACHGDILLVLANK